jgi:uncharacterized metal-binding protein
MVTWGDYSQSAHQLHYRRWNNEEKKMRYGIPLLKNRVSPRCTIADSLMLIIQINGELESHRIVKLENGAWTGLVRLLLENQVDTFVAGGIDRETRQLLTSHRLNIIDNVACTVDELLDAVARNALQPNYGFLSESTDLPSNFIPAADATENAKQKLGPCETSWETQGANLIRFNCLKCNNRVCLRGAPCYPGAAESYRETVEHYQATLETARDISCEVDRNLCRVAELVYFCLGMKYQRVGVAFCIDLIEPAGILTGLLERYFKVFPVCCKVGGIPIADPLLRADKHRQEMTPSSIACNPIGQADILNRLNTDINIIAGLCMGTDCLFTQASQAPVTTLFVKDKSLANNPIGAVYSDYYLNEVTKTPASENK